MTDLGGNIMSLETDLQECLDEKKALSKKRGRLMIYNSVATSAGVISVCALPISLIALIPLGASIGLGIYAEIKERETLDDMRILNTRYLQLEREEKRQKRLMKTN